MFNIEVRCQYRSSARSQGYTKKSWETHVLPVLEKYGAKMDWENIKLGLCIYKATIYNKNIALLFRKDLMEAYTRIGNKDFDGWHCKEDNE